MRLLLHYAYARRQDLPRPSTRFMKEYFKEKSVVGCEIGVAAGKNALSILQTLNVKRMYLIDPYLIYKQGDKTYYEFVDQKPIAKKRLEPFNVTWIYAKSEQGIKKIAEKLDFVYIDGNHEYKFVKNDLEMIYPLIKAGGIIAGHDFNSFWLGVLKAVFEFTNKYDLKIQGARSDFWIVKP